MLINRLYPLGTSMTQAQSVLLLYTLSGGVMVPFFPRKCLLHLPGGRLTGEGVNVGFGAGSLLTDSEADRKPEKKVFHKYNISV